MHIIIPSFSPSFLSLLLSIFLPPSLPLSLPLSFPLSLPPSLLPSLPPSLPPASLDYVAVNQTLNLTSTTTTVASGNSLTLHVEIQQDMLLEGRENFSILLSVEDGQEKVLLGNVNSVTVSITDDDSETYIHLHNF